MKTGRDAWATLDGETTRGRNTVKKLALLVTLLTVVATALAACTAPTPVQVKETVIVKETVVVEETVVRETVKEVTKEVVKVVTPTPEPAKPKVLVIGQAQEPDTLYGYGGSALAMVHVLHALTDGPIDSRTYDYQPVILESLPSLETGDAVLKKAKVKPGEKYVEAGEVMTATKGMELDQLVVTFKLKAGLKWEDGKPLTAHDSAFAFFLACHPDTPTSKYRCKRTASYVAKDDLTVEWSGLPGWMDATYFTNFWGPYPQHVLEEMKPKDILKSDYSRKPLSYGPFKMVEWVAGDHITVEKNPNYWRAQEGLPKLDKVIYKFIADANQLLVQLLAGKVDIGTQDGMSLDQVPFLLQAEKQGILKPVFQTGIVWEHIDFNIKPVDKRYVFFNDIKVRQAIAYGTDRKAMVDKILDGKSKVQHSYLPEEHPMFPPADKLVKYEYNPEKAKALLKEAGWTLNKEGYLEKGGQLFEVSLMTTAGNKVREQATQLFQQQMRQIGIKVKLEYPPASVLFAGGPDGPLFGRRFDLGQFPWLTGVEPPGELYMCSEIPGPENRWVGQNETGYCNPKYDEWVNKAKSTLKKDEQKKFWAEAQYIFTQELSVLPLFACIKVGATRPNVTGVIMDPTENSEMWNIENFDIVQ